MLSPLSPTVKPSSTAYSLTVHSLQDLAATSLSVSLFELDSNSWLGKTSVVSEVEWPALLFTHGEAILMESRKILVIIEW